MGWSWTSAAPRSPPFALALAAWTYPGAEGYRPLPELHIACSGTSVGANEAEWVRYAGNDAMLAEGMRRLHKLFKDAPALGSLIDPAREAEGDLFAADFTELQPLLQAALDKERQRQDFVANELGVAAYGLAKAAELLRGSITWSSPTYHTFPVASRTTD